MKTLDQKIDMMLCETEGRIQALKTASFSKETTDLLKKLRLRIAELKNISTITKGWLEFPPSNSAEENTYKEDKEKLTERIRGLVKDTTSCGSHEFALHRNYYDD